MPRRMAYDGWLFVTAGILALLGIIMVASASNYLAMSLGRSPYHYLMRHGFFLLAGATAFVGAMHLPYRLLDQRKVVLTLLVVSATALVAVLAMPPISGARRWFPLGPARLQPSEFAKLVLVVFTAYLLARKEDRIRDPWVVPIPCLTVTGILAGLVAIEPDLGSAVMMVMAVLVMLFVAGLRWVHIGAAASVGLVGAAAAIVAEPYRIERIRTFLDPQAEVQGAGFQLAQSLIALGSGGLVGAGLGHGQQKAYYLPAAHTDFIYSIAGEEFGLVGTVVVLAAFALLYWRGTRAALRAPDRFGFYLAVGLTSLLVVQGLVHMGVCLGILPTKGLPLPFVSYGGSSLVASMAAVGMLLNVSQHSN